VKALSVIHFGGFGDTIQGVFPGSQAGREAYWWVPTDQKLIAYCVTNTPVALGGRVLFVRPHQHLKPLWRSYLIASPDVSDLFDVYSATVQTGLFFWHPLEATGSSSFQEFESDLMRRAGPRMRCTFSPDYLVLDGVYYDKPGDMNGNKNMSCGTWLLRDTDQLLSVGLFKYVGGKHEPWVKASPTTSPMHLDWALHVDTDSFSCYKMADTKGYRGADPACTSSLLISPIGISDRTMDVAIDEIWKKFVQFVPIIGLALLSFVAGYRLASVKRSFLL